MSAAIGTLLCINARKEGRGVTEVPSKEMISRLLWVRAGGRCTLCKVYLLEGDISSYEVPLGEKAHIVGREESEKSARGLDPLPVAERDEVDNLMLACASCHNEIDKKKVEGLLDVDLLRSLKRQHEADIKTQTALLRDKRTAILRMAGDIRGDTMPMPRQQAAEAVIRSSGMFPFYIESFDRQGIEVDLHALDGEHPIEDSYYRAATRRIDACVARIVDGVHAGQIERLSIFALARLPLLVYLGAKLDDGIPADVYQRRRATDSWLWPEPDPSPDADFDLSHLPGDGGMEAALIVNLSGTTPRTDLPPHLQAVPTWVLAAVGGSAEDVISSPKVLARFREVVRQFFTDLEATHKHVTRLHLFGAIPLSAAVTLGRVLKAHGLRPSVVTYDREPGGYRPALEV